MKSLLVLTMSTLAISSTGFASQEVSEACSDNANDAAVAIGLINKEIKPEEHRETTGGAGKIIGRQAVFTIGILAGENTELKGTYKVKLDLTTCSVLSVKRE